LFETVIPTTGTSKELSILKLKMKFFVLKLEQFSLSLKKSALFFKLLKPTDIMM
jgi:hypothetical protein